MSNKGNKRGYLTGVCFFAVAGAVMALVAVGALGGCGGGNTGVIPFAGVWVANSGTPRAQHYAGIDFRVAGTFNVPPQPRLTTAFVSPQDTLFDAGNNLWLVDGGAAGVGAAVYKFLFNQVASLNTTPNPVPNLVVKATGATTFQFPQFAAFDTNGNLWVSDSAANAIFKFSALQLTATGGILITPAAVLTNSVPPAIPAFNGPLGIAFDGSGNLWVDNNGGTTIVELTAATLAAASGLTGVLATTVLNSGAVPGGLPTINNPWGILFDASGNMWITNEQNTPPPVGCAGSVVEFAKGTFSGPGSVTPAANVAIGPTPISGTFSLCDPNGITMDKAGNIVVANAVGNSLAQFTASQITASGNTLPHTFIAGAATLLNAPTGLTFGPLTLQ
ncbi:MAG TPA: hypothetical protein VGY99_15405 [Candidatus Binataceae bacterium]|jgi:hypothetical protein|nr:hypothetical protein [Candidatus Binataceae bacterium]